MVRDRRLSTLLVAAFLVVALAPILSSLVLAPITGAGSMAEMLARGAP
ncbi:MAG: hypothetical protein P8Z81_02430 [Deinococcales bacterium]